MKKAISKNIMFVLFLTSIIHGSTSLNKSNGNAPIDSSRLARRAFEKSMLNASEEERKSLLAHTKLESLGFQNIQELREYIEKVTNNYTTEYHGNIPALGTLLAGRIIRRRQTATRFYQALFDEHDSK